MTDAGVLEWNVILTGIRFGLDEVSWVFLAFTALLWPVCGVYAHFYLKGGRARVRFFSFYLASMAGNIGLVLAQDMVSFCLCFAVMTFSAYPLVLHDETPEAHRAGTVYILLAVIGEALIVTALILIASEAGGTGFRDIAGVVAASPRRDLVVALVLAGFGIKAGAVPLHVWLPLAHPVAPTPASAVLSGVIIKAGLLGWIRFLPLGAASLPEYGILCMAVGLAGAFCGVLVGLTQDNPKTVLAYSSISQMGLMLVALGTGLAWPQAWGAAAGTLLLFSLHHALNKASLFLGVGVAEGTDSPHRRRLVTAGLLLPALALAGAPFTGGETAKAVLASLDGTSGVSWPAWVAWGVSLSSLGTALLMARFCFVVRFAVKKAARGAAAGIRWVWAFLLALTASGAMLASRMGVSDASGAGYGENVLSALWPVLAGAGLYVLGRRLFDRYAAAFRLRIPAGDVLALIVPGWRALRGAWRRCAEKAAGNLAAAAAVSRAAAGRMSVCRDAVALTENHMTRWFAAGAAFLLLAAMWFVSVRGVL